MCVESVFINRALEIHYVFDVHQAPFPFVKMEKAIRTNFENCLDRRSKLTCSREGEASLRVWNQSIDIYISI